ncbi:uncharacterized protein LOC115878427 [Sitophilus oryzae]|uniref:Uncharacterized protein LOC115878427 n=1 Tax=Sitophilus oryzae TaxID=7048 RepID=A0A6J2XHP3_SITOR|nr:uncharacterized protein LOC115878427 [Sitophilus oryzae]
MDLKLLLEFVIFILSPNHIGCLSARQRDKSFHIYKLEDGCRESNGLTLPLQLKNIKIGVEDTTYKIAFNIVVNEDIYENYKLEFQLVRCKDKGSLNSCENFHKIPIPYFCKFLNNDGPWLRYVQALKPPLQCPMKKGLYTLPKGLTVDVKEIAKLRLADGSLFQIHIKSFGHTSNKLLFCAFAEGQVV